MPGPPPGMPMAVNSPPQGAPHAPPLGAPPLGPPPPSAAGGMAGPPPPPSAAMPGSNMGMGSAPSVSASVLADQMQALDLGVTTPTGQSGGFDAAQLPRPFGPPEGPMASPPNCPTNYIRMATTAIPQSQSLRQRWAAPLGLVVQPLAPPKTPGEACPVINFGRSGIIR